MNVIITWPLVKWRSAEDVEGRAEEDDSSNKVYYRPLETAVPVLKLYYPRMKNQPAAGDGRSSTKVVLQENEKPAGRRRRPFQY